MKVLFITNNFPPIIDGVGDYTYNLAKQFVKYKHEVYVVCKNNSMINTNINGVVVLPIVNNWDYRLCKPITDIIKGKEIDCVFLQYVPHGFQPKGLPFGLIKIMHAVKKTGVTTLTFFHEVCFDYIGLNIIKTFCSLGMIYIAKKIINDSNYIATSIEHYARRIKKIKKEVNISTIRIASNIPYHKYTTEDLELLRKKIAPNGEFIILFFGKRDINSHVEAIRELIIDGYKIVALSLGKTSFLLQDYGIPTYKTGLLDTNIMSQYFQIADCFCLPENEDCGCSFKSGALAAGLQYGLPIITNKGFMTESSLIGDKNVIFVQSKNINDIKTSIEHLIEDKNYSQMIKSNAFSIGESLNWESTYKKYINILK